MNSNKLKGKIVECRKTYQDCADALGISKAAFNYKINGRRMFNIDELEKLGIFLDMTGEELVNICFPNMCGGERNER